MRAIHFEYEPRCSFRGCARPARYKIAAVWTDGKFRELKPYGLACEEHREEVVSDANLRRGALRLADEERVEEIGVYRLARGATDATLERLT
jgi:hypothetical protein